jgi:predicted DNA-binding protein (MmcQ/YjbR family)
VKGKVFVFMGVPSEDLSFSLKLPSSSGMALMLPFAEPTGYGLGKAGWVTVRFTKGSQLPEETLLEWLDESYRAIAPKRIVKALPVK